MNADKKGSISADQRCGDSFLMNVNNLNLEKKNQIVSVSAAPPTTRRKALRPFWKSAPPIFRANNAS
jgi:hypothetical protein